MQINVLQLMWMTTKKREIARKSLNMYIGKNVKKV